MTSDYVIEDWYVMNKKDAHHSKGFYIRDILDKWSSEYKSSSITNYERLDIIQGLGLSVLSEVLKDCFATNNKPYNAEFESAVAYLLLCRELGVECKTLKISDDTSVGIFGINCKGSNTPSDIREIELFVKRMLNIV